jgi:hypothetical protein
MASKDEEICKYGTVDKRKHATSVILQKFEIIRLSESGKSQSVIRVHGTLEHQLSMISRNRRANYNRL